MQLPNGDDVAFILLSVLVTAVVVMGSEYLATGSVTLTFPIGLEFVDVTMP